MLTGSKSNIITETTIRQKPGPKIAPKAAAKKSKRGRLLKEEEREKKRTGGNVFSLLKKSPPVLVFKEHIHMVEEEPEDMEVVDRDR